MFAATYDVQNSTHEVIDNEIKVTGEFIINSDAMGCFIVLLSDDGSADQFRILLRSDSEDTVTDMISVPPSTYTEYHVYDLEEEGNVNTNPAILRKGSINVTTCKLNILQTYYTIDQKRLYVCFVLCGIHKFTDLNRNSSSNYLTRVVLSVSGSKVNVTCEFEDDYPEASCVLFYKEYNDTRLTEKEYDRSDEFPVTIYVDNSERYTFAVFGKNGNNEIDEEPVVTVKNESGDTYVKPKTRNGNANNNIYGG